MFHTKHTDKLRLSSATQLTQSVTEHSTFFVANYTDASSDIATDRSDHLFNIAIHHMVSEMYSVLINTCDRCHKQGQNPLRFQALYTLIRRMCL